MKFTRRDGPIGPRSVILAIAILGSAIPAFAQNAPKPSRDEQARFDQLRQGNQPISSGDKELFDKVAKYFADRLLDPNVQRESMSGAVRDVEKRLFPQNPYPRMTPEQRRFVEEFGRAMVAALEPMA